MVLVVVVVVLSYRSKKKKKMVAFDVSQCGGGVGGFSSPTYETQPSVEMLHIQGWSFLNILRYKRVG